MVINQLMRGEPLNPTLVVVSTLITIVLAGVLVVAVQLYKRERIVFRGH